MREAHAHKEHLPPWEAMELGHLSWSDFSPLEQESIVRHYGPKIRFLALRLKSKLPKSISLNEMISAGTLGLMEALGKFQPQLGVRFDTYAGNRIRGAMLDELRRLDWFPRPLRQKIRQIDSAMRVIERNLGRPATEEELVTMTGLELGEVRQGLEALQNQLMVSLDAVQDYMLDESQDPDEPYAVTAEKETLERLIPLISTLTPREKLVLSLYYSDELNMREVAEVMDITEGRVSQLHSQALKRLRQEFFNTYKPS